MKEINFSLHSLMKINLLSKHGFKIDPNLISQVIENPESVEIGKYGRLITQKKLDENHVLRVIYEEVENFVTVITVFPGRTKRYEKN
jgi:hypothetical protein